MPRPLRSFAALSGNPRDLFRTWLVADTEAAAQALKASERCAAGVTFEIGGLPASQAEMQAFALGRRCGKQASALRSLGVDPASHEPGRFTVGSPIAGTLEEFLNQ